MASSNLLLLLYTNTRHTHWRPSHTHSHTAAAAQVSAEKNKSQLVNGERLARHDAFCFATISQREVKRQPTNTNLFVSSDFFCCRRHTVQSRPHNNKQNTTHNFLINQKMQQHTHTPPPLSTGLDSKLVVSALLCGGERRKKYFPTFLLSNSKSNNVVCGWRLCVCAFYLVAKLFSNSTAARATSGQNMHNILKIDPLGRGVFLLPLSN
jgi:hypothetical protein